VNEVLAQRFKATTMDGAAAAPAAADVAADAREARLVEMITNTLADRLNSIAAGDRQPCRTDGPNGLFPHGAALWRDQRVFSAEFRGFTRPNSAENTRWSRHNAAP
jgi:hypothetical protein